MGKYVYFHEDSYCQKQILPSENLSFCLSEIANIKKFAKKYRKGLGFKKLYLRKKENVPLSTKTINRKELVSAIGKHLEEYHYAYYTDTGSIVKLENTTALGFMEFTIFIEFDDNDIVQEIWLSGFTKEEKQILQMNQAIEAIEAIEEKYALILIDWNTHACFPLSDSTALLSFCKNFLVKP